MRGGPQSSELPCLAPPVRECGEKNREGKENNLMAWNSPTADLQPNTKHTPGTMEAGGRKSCFPHHDPKTLLAPWGSRPPLVDPCPHKTPQVHHSSHPLHNLKLCRAGRPRLASHIRFNWHSGHKSERKDCENSVKGHSHALWDFSN